MSRKIYDVKPPKVASKVEDAIKSLEASAKKRKKRQPAFSKKDILESVEPIRTTKSALPQIPEAYKSKRFPMLEILVGGFIILLLIGIYFYNKLPWAEIQVYPRLEPITLSEKITADQSTISVDFKKKIIPVQLLEETKEASQDFPATGTTSNDGKSTGTILVYNKISPAAPLTLKTGTHFLSDSGKYFVTLAKIVIPAMQGKTPGSISVSVQAEQVGPDYNIGPSKFSVPKLSGTPYYYSIWAESIQAITGGHTGQVKKVTQDDLDSAKDVLTQKLLKDAESSLRSKIGQDGVLLDGSLVSNVVDQNSDAKANAVKDSFVESAKVKASALVVSRQDLEDFAKQDILSQVKEGEQLLEKSLDLKYDPDSIDFKKGIEKINLQVSAQIYYSINLNDLVGMAKRKSLDEVKSTANSLYGDKVSDVKIDFWPFWVHKTPNDQNRIKSSLNF